MVGDGSYLMMAQEIITSIQEGYKLIIVLLDSQRLRQHRRPVAIDRIGRLRHAVRHKVPVDLAANAESLGAVVYRAPDDRVVRGRVAIRARRRTDRGHLHAESRRAQACPATNRGGTCRWREIWHSPTSARRGSGGRTAKRSSAADLSGDAERHPLLGALLAGRRRRSCRT